MRKTPLFRAMLGMLLLPAFSIAQVSPDDFETGDTSNWQVMGATGVSTGLYNSLSGIVPGVVPGSLAIGPYAGSYLGILGDGSLNVFSGSLVYPDATGAIASSDDLDAFLGEAPGFLDSKIPDLILGPFTIVYDAFDGSAMVRSFPVNAGDTVTMQWNLNSGFFFGGGEGAPLDWAMVDIQLDDGTGSTVELLGSALNTWPGATQNAIRDAGSLSTGWQPLSITAPSDGTVTVRAVVVNGSSPGSTPTTFDSTALLLDADGGVPGGGGTNNAPICQVDTTPSDHMLINGQWVVTEGEALMLAFVGYDADGDPLTATVDQAPAGAQFSGLGGAQPLTVGMQWTPTAADDTGSHLIQVTFSDGKGGSSTCSFTVDDVNQLPVCDAGGDANGEQVTECQGGGASVTLTGTASDPDDAGLTYQWDVSDASVLLDTPNAASATGTFAMGTTMATLTVADGRGGISTCDVIVVVQDTLPPEVSCTTDVAALWPANHKMVPVEIYVEISDLCQDPSAVLLDTVHVRCDEPDDSTGDGSSVGDVDGTDGSVTPVNTTAQFVYDASQNAFCGTVMLRAERDGSGDGRAYTIDVTATDSSGNSTTSSCVVVVPHDKRGGK